MKVNKAAMRWAFAVVLSTLLLAGCREELSVEQQVIASLEHMEQSAEEGRHLDFMSYVADDFSGQYGGMDRREFHRFMIFQMSENRRLHAQFFPIHVKETGEGQASAHFNILVTGGGGLLPDRGQLFEVETDWSRDGNDWLLSKADWEPVDLSQR
jgi:hypothetical protein